MKRIAYCLISDGMGGAENIVLQTLQYFGNYESFYLIINNEIAENFKGVVTNKQMLNIGDVYLHKKYRFVRYLLNNRFYNFRRCHIDRKTVSIKKFVADNDIDIMHTHLDYALYLGLKMKKEFLQNLKIIFTAHSAFGLLKSKELRPQLAFKYIDFTKVDSIVFVSKYVYDLYRKEVPINHYQIIYNGIDSTNILPLNREYKPSDCFNILYLGGEKFVKGYDVLLDTIELLSKKSIQLKVKFYILGLVSNDGVIQQFIESKNLQDFVEVVGFITSDQINSYFDVSHMLIMPSRTEAMPLAAIEAVYRDLPIVATAVGGIPEIVTNEENGYCVDLNHNLFSDKIVSIMNSYPMFIVRTKMFNQKIKSQFSLEYMCESLLKYYDSLSL